MNPAAQAMLELSESRYLGSSLGELFPGQLEFVQLRDPENLPDHPFTNRSIDLTTSGGHQLAVDCTVSPMITVDREIEGLILELHPVDRILRINREEGLIASQQTTQALLRGLAHEIKNPLGGLRGAAQLLARLTPRWKSTPVSSSRSPTVCETWWTACWGRIANRSWPA